MMMMIGNGRNLVTQITQKGCCRQCRRRHCLVASSRGFHGMRREYRTGRARQDGLRIFIGMRCAAMLTFGNLLQRRWSINNVILHIVVVIIVIAAFVLFAVAALATRWWRRGPQRLHRHGQGQLRLIPNIPRRWNPARYRTNRSRHVCVTGITTLVARYHNASCAQREKQ